MAINYRGTNIENVYYRGTQVNIVYKWDDSLNRYTLVYQLGEDIYVNISFWDRSETTTEQVTNPAYGPWKTEDDRLKGEMETEQGNFSTKFNAWQGAINARKNREQEVKDAYTKYDEHHNDPNKPSETKPNPNYDPNKTIEVDNPNYDPNETIKNPSYDSWSSLNSSYESAKASADQAYRDWQNAIGKQPQSVVDNLERSYRTAAYNVLVAGGNLDSAFPNGAPDQYIPNPDYDDRKTIWIDNEDYDPNETIPDPSYKPWVEEDDRLAKAYSDANAKWATDKPSYDQAVTSAYNALEAQKPITGAAEENYRRHHDDPNKPPETIPSTYTKYYPNLSAYISGTIPPNTNDYIDVSLSFGGYNRSVRLNRYTTTYSYEGGYSTSSHSAGSYTASGSDGKYYSDSNVTTAFVGPFIWKKH